AVEPRPALPAEPIARDPRAAALWAEHAGLPVLRCSTRRPTEAVTATTSRGRRVERPAARAVVAMELAARVDGDAHGQLRPDRLGSGRSSTYQLISPLSSTHHSSCWW